MPLADRGRVIGFIGFEAARSEWSFSVNHVMTLRSAAGILAQAFAKRTAEERLAFQASHDPLTGLPNRWSFQEALRAGVDELARRRPAAATGDGAGLAVLLFDLDRFKVINDSLGHRLGDQLLLILAQRMDEARPAGTVLARMGGDELVVLVEGLDAVAQAVAVARAPARGRAAPGDGRGPRGLHHRQRGHRLHRRADQSADDLLRHADAALYAAKEFGRDRIEVFDETLRAKVRRRLQNEIELRQALDHGQLVVHYQPEMEVPSGRMMAVEALVRWHHPERGLLAAAEFIDLAEETGLITELGLWVLREACAQQVRWLQEFPDHELQMRVNLSAVQLGQPDLLSQVVEIVHETGIAAWPAVPGDHRDGGDGRRRELPGPAREAARPGAGAGHRRLRHRLLVAQLPQAAPGERVEDRPVLRGRVGHRSRRHGHRRRGHGAGLVAGAAGDRRGRRERGRSCASCCAWAASGCRATTSAGPRRRR